MKKKSVVRDLNSTEVKEVSGGNMVCFPPIEDPDNCLIPPLY